MVQKGMALAIFFPDHEHMLVVKGRKFEIMIIDYARSYARELPITVRKALALYSKIWSTKNWPERVQFFRSRNAYCLIRDWVRSEGEKRADVPDTKRDKLALVGGGILDNEFVDYPNAYGEYACVREAVEESGLIIVDEATKENLFSLIGRYWEQDRELPRGNFHYENLVYWVHEARGQERDQLGFPVPRDRGVPGETFAAFYIKATQLDQGNFHRKHGFIVREALRKKVKEDRGYLYRPALEHFEANFPDITSLHLEPSSQLETASSSQRFVSDDDAFRAAMEGVAPLSH